MATGTLITEEKDFTTLGDKKTGRKVEIPIAFWPFGTEEQMNKVLNNMKKEHPESLFYEEMV